MGEAEPMSPQQLAVIRERLEQAAPGPWSVSSNWVHRVIDRNRKPVAMYRTRIDMMTLAGLRIEDAEFIAHAPEDILALLGEIERLKGLFPGCRA
jgi:hypothetical protein